mmetsp:Transcript_881/g.1079  ORF Transcript_881/g.1079 Transcript_881/m.1079 type:complete len:86 (+) Transcript_881:80-337(+)
MEISLVLKKKRRGMCRIQSTEYEYTKLVKIFLVTNKARRPRLLLKIHEDKWTSCHFPFPFFLRSFKPMVCTVQRFSSCEKTIAQV